MTGLWVAAAAVGVAAAVLVVRRVRDGRFRAGRRAGAPPEVAAGRGQEPAGAPTAWSQVVAAVPEARAGGRATLVQFSTSFCAPCRATRTLLTAVAAAHDDVSHVEVDAEAHRGLVRDLGVLRTPTTILVDADGREVLRASGAPRRDQVEAALAGVPAPDAREGSR